MLVLSEATAACMNETDERTSRGQMEPRAKRIEEVDHQPCPAAGPKVLQTHRERNPATTTTIQIRSMATKSSHCVNNPMRNSPLAQIPTFGALQVRREQMWHQLHTSVTPVLERGTEHTYIWR